MTIELNQMPLPDFWTGLRSEFIALSNRAVKTLMPFATMYLCESGFSALPPRLRVGNDLRLRLSPRQPNTAELCASFQAQSINQTINQSINQMYSGLTRCSGNLEGPSALQCGSDLWYLMS